MVRERRKGKHGMTSPTSLESLSLEERHLVKQAAARLLAKFAGVLNAETIERFMTESIDRFLPSATVTAWVPLLAERFTHDRLRA